MIQDESYFDDYNRLYKYFNPSKEFYVNYKESIRRQSDNRSHRLKSGRNVKEWFGNKCVFCGDNNNLHVANIIEFHILNDHTVYNLMCVCKKHINERLKYDNDYLINNIVRRKLKQLHPEII